MKKYFLIFTIFLTACADPKYLSSQSYQNPQGPYFESNCSIQFQNSHLCLDWKWESAPTQQKKGTFYFKVYRRNNLDKSPVLLDLASPPDVILWMPSMSHGSSPVSVSQEDVGTYRAHNVFFIMTGDWEIKIQVKENGQVIDEAIITLDI